MKIITKKIVCSALTVILSASILGGCEKNKTVGDLSNSLTYWAGIPLGDGSSDAAELPFVKSLKDKTGIDVSFTVPATDNSQKVEQFNMLVASSDFPDIIEWSWATFKGGAEGAIDTDVIIPLNKYIDEGKCPNLKAYLDANPEIDKLVKTDSGQYYTFPFIREDEKSRIFNGPILRADWLKELGLSVPETIDEWENVLTEFKEKKGAAAPLTLLLNFWDTGAFAGAYGVKNNFMVDDNKKVKYGIIEDGYKQYLKKMNQWYKKGLLDNNFAQLDSNMLNSQMTSGASGAAIYSAGGGIGKWLGVMSNDKAFDLVGAKYPVLKKGDTPMFGTKMPIFQGQGASISTSCKNPELAIELLDYAFSAEGRMLFNFGTEGVDYTMVDGNPVFTDYVTKNTDGKTMSEIIAMDTRATGGPFVQDVKYTEQFLSLPQQKNAISNWAATDDEKYALPQVNYTPDEMSEYSDIMSAVNTLTSEKFIRYIQGTENIDETWDKFVSDVKKMNIDRAIELTQNAYDRYQDR